MEAFLSAESLDPIMSPLVLAADTREPPATMLSPAFFAPAFAVAPFWPVLIAPGAEPLLSLFLLIGEPGAGGAPEPLDRGEVGTVFDGDGVQPGPGTRRPKSAVARSTMSLSMDALSPDGTDPEVPIDMPDMPDWARRIIIVFGVPLPLPRLGELIPELRGERMVGVQPSPSRIISMNSWKSMKPSPSRSKSWTSRCTSTSDRSPSKLPLRSSSFCKHPSPLISRALNAAQHTPRWQYSLRSNVAAKNSVYEYGSWAFMPSSLTWRTNFLPQLSSSYSASLSSRSFNSMWSSWPSSSVSRAQKASLASLVCSSSKKLAMMQSAARLNLFRERKPRKFRRIV
mmetsp:Transcript_101028/g.290740  ORF Transcript_101028/g.290740 Transcript_101028/m.290740 type:complete len:341 (+) Transcript_101028:228-1250(+)